MGRILVLGDPAAVADPEDPVDPEAKQVDQAEVVVESL